MARQRSYLNRVASPLAAGVQLLSAARQPHPDEKRPPAMPGLPASRLEVDAQEDALAPPTAHPALPFDTETVSSSAPPATGAPDLGRQPPGPPPEPPNDRDRVARPIPQIPLPKESDRSTTPAVAAAKTLTPELTLQPDPEPELDSFDANARQTPAAPLRVADSVATREASGPRIADSAGVQGNSKQHSLEPPPQRTPVPTPDRRTADSPNIYIGTIEVRNALPPPAAAPSAADVNHSSSGARRESAAAPVAHGYRWRVGLMS